MDGLQRSETSFRRQGSSGLVWDDKLLAGELLKRVKPKDDDQQDGEQLESRQPNRTSQVHTYRTAKEVDPTIDPPSSKVSGCGFCGMFGKPQKTQKPHNKSSAKRKL